MRIHAADLSPPGLYFRVLISPRAQGIRTGLKAIAVPAVLPTALSLSPHSLLPQAGCTDFGWDQPLSNKYAHFIHGNWKPPISYTEMVRAGVECMKWAAPDFIHSTPPGWPAASLGGTTLRRGGPLDGGIWVCRYGAAELPPRSGKPVVGKGRKGCFPDVCISCVMKMSKSDMECRCCCWLGLKAGVLHGLDGVTLCARRTGRTEQQ